MRSITAVPSRALEAAPDAAGAAAVVVAHVAGMGSRPGDEPTGGVGGRSDEPTGGVGGRGDEPTGGVGGRGDEPTGGVGGRGDEPTGGVGGRGDEPTGGVGAGEPFAGASPTRDDRLTAAVYLARGGRLRCVARRGAWAARDGVAPTSGVLGRTYRTATETIARNAVAFADDLAAGPGVVTQACFPLLVAGDPVGVLEVASREPLSRGDVVDLRSCAIALAERLGALAERLGALAGVGDQTPAERLLAHTADLATLDDREAIARAAVAAALDVTPFDSAVLARVTPAGTLTPIVASGPLSDALRAARLDRIAAWVGGGASCFTAGELEAPAPIELEQLRAAGARTLAAVGLAVRGDLVGVLLATASVDAAVSTDDVELLERLADHAAASLHTAELLRNLHDRAASDPLTGLGHHATFHEALGGSHRRPSTAVVLCDIDGFKRLNDTYGHAHGDRVLCGLADAMSGALRRGDSLFRIGGDEFAALLAVGSEAEALDAAARLRAAVNEARLGVTVSIGVAVPRAHESDTEVLVRADRALYRVKAAGRDGVALANDEPLPATPIGS